MRELSGYDNEVLERRDDVADEADALRSEIAEVEASQQEMRAGLAAANAAALRERLRARPRLRRELAAARAEVEGLTVRLHRAENEVVQLDTELAHLESWLLASAGDDELALARVRARSSRTFSGRVPAGVVFYASAADFAAEDPRRATRAYDRASEAENRTILGGSDWGYTWRLELGRVS